MKPQQDHSKFKTKFKTIFWIADKTKSGECVFIHPSL